MTRKYPPSHGFGSMTPEERKAMASRGGKAAQAKGHGNRFQKGDPRNSELGRLGAEALHSKNTTCRYILPNASVTAMAVTSWDRNLTDEFVEENFQPFSLDMLRTLASRGR